MGWPVCWKRLKALLASSLFDCMLRVLRVLGAAGSAIDAALESAMVLRVLRALGAALEKEMTTVDD